MGMTHTDSEVAGMVAALVFQTRHPDTYSHTLRVARNFPEHDAAHVVALLHDTLEDAPELISYDFLLTHFGITVATAVLTLTRSDNETYWDYVYSVAQSQGVAGGIAKMVKRADAQDNLERSIGQSRRQDRYQRVLDILGPQ